MKRTTIVVSSITAAMQGEKLLREHGFRAFIDRDTALFGKYGCGYCVRVTGNANGAVELLQKRKVKIREVVID